jgi:transketolase
VKIATDAVIYDGKGQCEIKEKAYTNAIHSLGEKYDNVVCLTADMTYLLEVKKFQESFPDRAFNVGMAEQNMIGIASGLAQAGEVAFAHTFCCFITRRCMDQIVNAVAYPRRNVKIVGMMPGITSNGGPSHQAIDDLSLMRGTPNITVLDLGDFTETAQAVQVAYNREGPVYLRIRRAMQPVLFDSSKYQLEVGQSYLLRKGSDVSLVSSGLMTKRALEAAVILEEKGISANVLHIPSIKPIDVEGILEVAGNCRALVTLDNHNIIGGLGSAVGEVLLDHNAGVPFHRIGIPDRFGVAASEAYLAQLFGLEPQQIADTVVWVLDGKKGSHEVKVREVQVDAHGGGWEEDWRN